MIFYFRCVVRVDVFLVVGPSAAKEFFLEPGVDVGHDVGVDYSSDFPFGCVESSFKVAFEICILDAFRVLDDVFHPYFDGDLQVDCNGAWEVAVVVFAGVIPVVVEVYFAVEC